VSRRQPERAGQPRRRRDPRVVPRRAAAAPAGRRDRRLHAQPRRHRSATASTRTTCGAVLAADNYTIRRAPRGRRASEDSRRTHRSDEAPPRLPGLRRAIAALPGARRGRRAVAMAFAELRHRREVAPGSPGSITSWCPAAASSSEFRGRPVRPSLHAVPVYAGAARRAGARLDILSVGTGTLATPLGAGGSSGARSRPRAIARFRDARSRELAQAAGAQAGDPTRPRPGIRAAAVSPGTRAARPPADRRRADVLRRPGVWPKPDASRYAHHLASMAAIAARRAVRDCHEVRDVRHRPARRRAGAECHAIAAS